MSLTVCKGASAFLKTSIVTDMLATCGTWGIAFVAFAFVAFALAAFAPFFEPLTQLVLPWALSATS